ncbi:MAG: alpha-L-arabinofuranosidase [Planctomycetes bacterium]|nr:alpha-L-arabinofuranosidase [Planctomycetota bacterium]
MLRILPLVLLLAGFAAAQADPDGPDGSFDSRAGDAPRGWFRSAWAGRGEQTLVADAGRGGSACVSIRSASGADIAWSSQWPVRPFSRYRLTGWVRTVGVAAGTGMGALLNLHGRGREACTPAVTGDSDGWRRVELEFDTGTDDVVMVNCLFGGWGSSTGTAFYDDVSVDLIEAGALPPPSIVVHADERLAPISPYVYGQFIEHLGRCIQGGIWAELLPDRKFLHPLGGSTSPWSLLGRPDQIVDVRAPRGVPVDARFGDCIAALELRGGEPGGLRHGGLPLTEGRAYALRLWIRGAPGCGAVTVDLSGASAELPAPAGTWAQREVTLTATATTDDGQLTIRAEGAGELWFGPLSLMPADNVHGMRRDTLELLRELGAPVYRWPGGNFVSGYDWHDGIGDRDVRPARKNPAWQGIESNDFGLHEFITFCRLVGAEPYVAVNAGSGDAASAAELVGYCNDAPETERGSRRAANGDVAPFGVRIWGIGNEMYGGWQIGHMPVADYVRKHADFAAAMRAVDPRITLVAVGAVGGWDEAMLAGCEGALDHFSEHIYVQERPGVYSHSRLLPDAIRHVADAWRGYRRRFDWVARDHVRIAMDEWNHWYGPHVFGELGTRYYLKDALGVAAGLHEFFRNSDLFWMANYAQTVNVIGCIKTTPRAAAFETTGLVLKLYRHRFGSVPVRVDTEGLVDACAAWSDDGSALTLGIVNATAEPMRIPLRIDGAAPRGSGRRFVIAGDDPLAFNDPDAGMRVTIAESAMSALGEAVEVAPLSITVLVLDVR